LARRTVVRSFGARGRVGAPRLTEWFGSSNALVDDFTTVAANTLVLVTNFPAAVGGSPDKLPGTIIRTRGVLSIGSDQGAALEVQTGALGGAIVTEAAFTAGGAALPDPVSDSSAGFWFLYEPFAQKNFNNLSIPTQLYTFDSKAMRKIEPGEMAVFMLVNAHATHGLTFLLNIRMLIKLH